MSISVIISGLVTGLLLGIFGSGGSIVTMPALLYLLDVEPKSAIAMSLGIVTITATIAAFQHWVRGNVNLKITAMFGLVWRNWNLCRCVIRHYYTYCNTIRTFCHGNVCCCMENV